MSPAGMVTGSMKERGSLEPGGGLRNCGFRGTPLERVGSTARRRRIRSQMPVDWIVYFCGVGVSGRGDGIGGGRDREGRRTLWTGTTRSTACRAFAAVWEAMVAALRAQLTSCWWRA